MSNTPEASRDCASKVPYRWVFLFLYNVEVEYPFSCENVKDLECSGFPFHLLEGPLDDESRTVPYQLFTGQKFCVFAKVQSGRKHF